MRKEIHYSADYGTCDCHPWHILVAYLPPCEQPKGEQTQQGAVSIGAEDVNGVDDTGGVYRTKDQYEEHEEYGYHQMGSFAQPLIVRPLVYVNAIGSGKCRERGIRAGEACRHDAYSEEHRHGFAHYARRGEHRHQVIARRGEGNAFFVR